MSWQTVKLNQFQIFSFHCITKTSLQIQSGLAEISGWELPVATNLHIRKSTRSNIVTFKGCVINYICTDMQYKVVNFKCNNNLNTIYLNIHSRLDEYRIEGGRGPRLLIIGQLDHGKSDLFKTFVNYTLKTKGKIMAIDLDVDHNTITMPGCFSALVVSKKITINTDWDFKDPIVTMVHSDYNKYNVFLFSKQIKALAELVNSKLDNNPNLQKNGLIIKCDSFYNPDLSQGLRIGMLTRIIEYFQIDNLISIGDENVSRLISELSTVTIVNIPKPVHEFDYTIEDRQVVLGKYFIGYLGRHIFPHDMRLTSRSQMIYILPTTKCGKPEEFTIYKKLNNAILGLSQATCVDEIETTPIYGFIQVINVDPHGLSFVIRSPSAGLLPTKLMILLPFRYEMVAPF